MRRRSGLNPLWDAAVHRLSALFIVTPLIFIWFSANRTFTDRLRSGWQREQPAQWRGLGTAFINQAHVRSWAATGSLLRLPIVFFQNPASRPFLPAAFTPAGTLLPVGVTLIDLQLRQPRGGSATVHVHRRVATRDARIVEAARCQTGNQLEVPLLAAR